MLLGLACAALACASSDDALVRQMQIARSYGQRGDFERARQILKDIEPQLAQAGDEVRARHALEFGRTLSSATHPPESQTAAVREQARAAFMRAFHIASAARLDAIAIDALHMMAFVDTAPADQLAWGARALALMQASAQADARAWEGSLRNNVGHALYQLGRYDDALQQFRLALAARERAGQAEPIRVAWWMAARTLRVLGLLDEAREIQLRLEREWDAVGGQDPYVLEELELLYRARGDFWRADTYAARRRALRQ